MKRLHPIAIVGKSDGMNDSVNCGELIGNLFCDTIDLVLMFDVANKNPVAVKELRQFLASLVGPHNKYWIRTTVHQRLGDSEGNTFSVCHPENNNVFIGELKKIQLRITLLVETTARIEKTNAKRFRERKQAPTEKRTKLVSLSSGVSFQPAI